MYISKIKLFFLFLLVPTFLFSQVQIRDSIISWQHHSFQLNADFSMNNYSTANNVRTQAYFNAKVIENDLIRLVVMPEYGARVISFVYKPSAHEFLYQSECGSPYGMNEGNFYYDWLMVYGGIFPTFPEPEHGKTWFLPWEYDLVKNTGDTVIIGMEYTDNNSFVHAPGQFNNGITNITCRIEVGVYSGSSLWDFKVSLRNNKDVSVAYEYWTCTTLTPGSDIGDTGSPLNTEMLAPIDRYRAGWSPGSWVGNYGGLYDFSRINLLSKWNDMGIAYAYDLKDNYWGVINHENEEGIFRISENIETPGMKFWTWGKNNIDNNLFDFSNGGRDNYIELWAGVSESFFTDATLSPQEEKAWTESYSPTIGLSSLTKINRNLAVNIGWNQDKAELYYELLAFNPNREYRLNMNLDGESYYAIVDETIITSALGNREGYIMDNLSAGNYTVSFEVYDGNDILLLSAEKEISLLATGLDDFFSENSSNSPLNIKSLGNRMVNISLPENVNYELQIYNLSGQQVASRKFWGSSIELTVPSKGIYIFNIRGGKSIISKKVLIN